MSEIDKMDLNFLCESFGLNTDYSVYESENPDEY